MDSHDPEETITQSVKCRDDEEARKMGPRYRDNSVVEIGNSWERKLIIAEGLR